MTTGAWKWALPQLPSHKIAGPADTVITALEDPKADLHLSEAWTLDPQKLRADKHVLLSLQ